VRSLQAKTAFVIHQELVVCDPAENIYISGTIQGTTSFGGNVVAPVAKSDVTIAKLGNNMITGLLENTKIQTASLYPNPFSHELFIGGSETIKAIKELILYDESGRQVLSLTLPEGENSFTLPLSLASGIYFYALKGGEEVLGRGKLVRE
jgi:hypothetical protein